MVPNGSVYQSYTNTGQSSDPSGLVGSLRAKSVPTGFHLNLVLARRSRRIAQLSCIEIRLSPADICPVSAADICPLKSRHLSCLNRRHLSCLNSTHLQHLRLPGDHDAAQDKSSQKPTSFCEFELATPYSVREGRRSVSPSIDFYNNLPSSSASRPRCLHRSLENP